MEEQKKTLVILTPAFAVNGENWLTPQAAFVRKLNELYPSLHIVILVFHFPIVEKRRFKWFGNDIVAFNGGRKGGARTPFRWIGVWKELNRINKRHSVLGLFSFFCSESAFIGHHYARRKGLKHFIWVLGQDARKSNYHVKRIKPRADELIAISDFLVREFERSHGVRPKHVIPIGIDPSAYESDTSTRSIDILGVGTLSAIKQYDLFVDIIAQLRQFFPDIKAVICGSGTERNGLQAQIEREQLVQQLQLAGEYRHSDIPSVMLQSKILLHPSSYEGFGIVCTEALCAGAHVISFCKPMKADIPHWHIVEGRDQMLSKCIELLQDKNLDHSRVLPFDLKDTAVKIIRLFDSE